MNLLSFDIEISDVFDLAPGEDLDDHAPFHISIASTAVHGGEEKLWYSTTEDGTPSITSPANVRASCWTISRPCSAKT